MGKAKKENNNLEKQKNWYVSFKTGTFVQLQVRHRRRLKFNLFIQ